MKRQPEESQPKKKGQMKVMNDFSLVLPSLTGVAIFTSLLSQQLSILQGHTKRDITCLLRLSTLQEITKVYDNKRVLYALILYRPIEL